MKRNIKNKLQLMDENELMKRFNYLKSKKGDKKDSNVMKYIKYHLKTRFNKILES